MNFLDAEGQYDVTKDSYPPFGLHGEYDLSNKISIPFAFGPFSKPENETNWHSQTEVRFFI